MPRANVKVVISEKGPGIAAFAAELAGAELRIGVQGDEAAAQHPNSDMTVGALAEKHELGLGVPERSWLRAWFDRNQEKCQAETAAAMQLVMTKKLSRKKAMEQLGYKWVELIRDDIVSGKVTPALAASTIKRKGHGVVLWETGTLTNAITFRLFLAQIKSIKDPKVREVLRSTDG